MILGNFAVLSRSLVPVHTPGLSPSPVTQENASLFGIQVLFSLVLVQFYLYSLRSHCPCISFRACFSVCISWIVFISQTYFLRQFLFSCLCLSIFVLLLIYWGRWGEDRGAEWQSWKSLLKANVRGSLFSALLSPSGVYTGCAHVTGMEWVTGNWLRDGGSIHRGCCAFPRCKELLLIFVQSISVGHGDFGVEATIQIGVRKVSWNVAIYHNKSSKISAGTDC